jgi:hypothetical protein
MTFNCLVSGVERTSSDTYNDTTRVTVLERPGNTLITIGRNRDRSFQFDSEYADSGQPDARECDRFPLALTGEDTWPNGTV